MNGQKGDIVVNGNSTTIVFERVLHHSIDKVWEAITNPDDLSVWMLQSAIVEGRVGGKIEFVSTPTPLVWFGTIITWDPPRVFEHELNTDADPRWSDHLGAE